MILSWITYGLLVLLILFGGKFAFGKNKFNDDFLSLDVTKSLRGLAAIGVILHHISQEGAFQKVRELSPFVNAGFYFVAIFFFCSGFGLIKSLKSKENYLDGFLKNRVLKTIIVPFYVCVLIYGIYKLIIGVKMPVAHWITNLLGLTLMNDYAWYPIVLAILYIAFYFIFKYVKNRKLSFALMFLVIFAQGVFFAVTGHFAWWAGEPNWWLQPNGWANAQWWMQQKIMWFFGEWWVNSSIAFFIGMLYANFEEKIVAWFKKGYWIKLLALLVLWMIFNFVSGMAQWKLGYWSEYSGKGPGVFNKFVCYLSQLPQVTFFVLFVFTIMMKFYSVNPITKFFGNISYETYMMNLIAIEVFRFLLYKINPVNGWQVPFYKDGNYNLAIYAVAVLAGTVLLGLIYRFLNNQAKKLIK